MAIRALLGKDKTEVTLKSGDTRSAWKGNKTMTDVPAERSHCAHATLAGAEGSVFAEDFSTFYGHFDIHAFSSEVNEIKHSCSVKDDEIEITEDAVLKKMFKAINVRKSSGYIMLITV